MPKSVKQIWSIYSYISMVVQSPKTRPTQYNQKLTRVSWPAVIHWAGLLLKMSLWIQLLLRKVNRSVQPHITSLKLTVTCAQCLCQALCLWLLSYDWQSGGTFRNCRYYNFPKGMHGQSKKCNTMFSKIHITCMGLNGRIRHFPLKCILECLISLFPV